MFTFHDIDWAAAEAGAEQVLSGDQLRLFKRADPQGVGLRWSPQLSKALMPKARWDAPQPWR
jgi:hypothetical protein